MKSAEIIEQLTVMRHKAATDCKAWTALYEAVHAVQERDGMKAEIERILGDVRELHKSLTVASLPELNRLTHD